MKLLEKLNFEENDLVVGETTNHNFLVSWLLQR